MRLIDRFGRIHTYLRISVTDRCNLRCIYCMPHSGIGWKAKEEILTFEEIYRLAKIFVSLGVNKIRLTGGEPTIRKNIEQLIQMLSALARLKTLAMTTNGILLKDKAFTTALKKAGLNNINISLDTLKKERFVQIARREYFDWVIEGIDTALEAGFNPLKLNVVVMANINTDEILDFVHFVQDKPINVRFIEYMPFKDNGWRQASFFSYIEMKNLIEQNYKLIPHASNSPGSIAKDFYIEGFKGTISFITSMTESFCSSCNRIRLTADGSLKTCLFYKPEFNLRNMLRDDLADEVIKDVICSVLQLKNEAHPPLCELITQSNQSMIQIGG